VKTAFLLQQYTFKNPVVYGMIIYMTAFQIQVFEQVKKIPSGRLATYVSIARAIGKPSAMQAVGNALRSNEKSFITCSNQQGAIPCHRVVKNDGQLGGFNAGAQAKQRLLEAEQHSIENGRIVEFSKKLMTW
jgi:O-6-methylguanine DNA methyltransferase